MFIKEITVSGFKSYRDKTTVPELDNGLNVIVGRNGSGKSNIFAAIECALTLEHRRMNSETRSSLISHGRALHEACFVEIVFDNTGRKLPVPCDIVKFRRVLGSKKDHFTVNGKAVPSANVKKFLDIAGFSNPYFIVKQGKVHDLAVATDQARLKTIYDITGTTEFDTKRSHCVKSIKDSNAEIKDIKTMLADLNVRKNALETEATEQSRFVKLDQGKRAIEHVMFERKGKEIQKNLDHLIEKRDESSRRQAPIRKEAEKVARELQISRRDVEEMEESMRQLQDLNKDYELSKLNLTKNLVSQRQELQDRKNRKEVAGNSISQLEKEIEETKRLVDEIDSDMLELDEPLQVLCNEKCQLEERANVFQEIELGKKKFKRADYKQHIKNKLAEVSKKLEYEKTQLQSLRDSENSTRETLASEQADLEKMRNDLASCVENILKIRLELENSKTLEFDTKNSLNAVCRQLSETEQKLAQKKDRVSRLQEECRKSFGYSVFDGSIGVKNVIESFKMTGTNQEIVEGYYGLVCEVFRCDAKLDFAVDAAGGKRMLHHVVKSKEMAEVILAEFNKRSYHGEVHFIPLDTLKDVSNIIADSLKGAKPIIGLLEFDKKFSRLMKFVFGNVLLCSDLEIAAGMMRQFKVPCVTVDGEKVSHDGVISGGYIHNRPRKLELQRSKKVDENEMEQYSRQKSFLDLECGKLNEEHKQIKGKNEKLCSQKSALERTRRVLLCQIETSEKKISSFETHLKLFERQIKAANLTIHTLNERKNGFNSASTSSKFELMEKLHQKAKEYAAAAAEYAAKQTEKSTLDAKLKQLYKRYYKEVESLSQTTEEDSKNEITRLTELVDLLMEEISEVNTKIKNNTEEIAVLGKSIIFAEKKVDKLLENESKVMDELRSIGCDLEGYISKYAALQQRLEDHNQSAKDLRSVPASLAAYEELSDKQLYSKLKKINRKLKKAAEVGINQKAAGEFELLAANIEKYEERLQNLVESEKELVALLRDVEAKKAETTLNSVRVLQQEFKEVFCKIVPNGNAELILYKNTDTVDHEDNIDRFDGARVSANFSGKQLYNTKNLAQFSGGQKTVIALSLILAIQKVDPVPFYLFDEVDQALDEIYRNSVARLVGIMSEGSQFICTTFRKELVEVADRVYGVSYQNRNSHIVPITDTQAYEFVEDSEQSGRDSESENTSQTSSLSTASDNNTREM